MEPMTDLKQILAYLSLGGSAIAAATVSGLLLEKWDKFTQLAAGTKFIITLTISLALGLGATAALTLPATTLQALQPYFAAGVMSVAPLIGQQLAHKILKKSPVITATTVSENPTSTTTTISSDGPPPVVGTLNFDKLPTEPPS